MAEDSDLAEAKDAWERTKADEVERRKHQAEVDNAVIVAGRTNSQLVWLTLIILGVAVATLIVALATLART